MTKFKCPRCFRDYKKKIKDKIGFRCDNCGRNFEVNMSGCTTDIPEIKGIRFTSDECKIRGGAHTYVGEIY